MKNKHLKLHLGIAFSVLCLCVSGVKNAVSACPGDPHFDRRSVIQFTGDALPPTYFHNYSTAQIESMRHIRIHSGLQHNPGLTLAEHQLKTDCQIGSLTHGRGKGVCVWMESLQLYFGFNKMDVFLSSNYAEGTCPYRIVLWHENQHVAINTRVFKKYRALMERAVRRERSIPTKGNPLSVGSLQQGKAVITAKIGRIVNPLYARFKNEVAAENAKIDTPANYRRTQALCKEW